MQRLLESFKNKLHKQIPISEEKIKALTERLFSRTLKKYPKPIMAIYLTTETMSQISRNDGMFLKRIANNVRDKYYILCLPALSAEQVRIEIWFAGVRGYKIEKKIYENNIWAFHDIMNMNTTLKIDF